MIRKSIYTILLAACWMLQAHAQENNFGYRFPKAGFRVSLLLPEVSIETASKKGSTFLLGVGMSADVVEGALLAKPYIYAQYRYYFNSPAISFLNDSKRAEGFYLHGGAYTYQSRVAISDGSLILGLGGGMQTTWGRYFFTDVFLAPGLAVLSDGQLISFAPTVTAGLRVGIELTAFDDD